MAVRTAYVGTQVAGDVLTSANFTKLPGGWIGYSEATANQTGITTVVDLTNLSVTVTVGASRRLKITGKCLVQRTVADGIVLGYIQEGGAVLNAWCNRSPANTTAAEEIGEAIVTPSAGSHTYKLTLQRFSGTGTVGITPSATEAAFILVEDIGPA